MTTTIAEIMTHDVTVISPNDNVQQAAKMMADWNVGSLPVCNGKRLEGIITDRDITVRAVASGKTPSDVRVSDIMSSGTHWCFQDQTVGEVLQQMGDAQIRRLPVVDRNMELVGIVALGDIATRHKAEVDSTLEEISSPSEPNRPSGNRGAAQSDAGQARH